MWGSSSGYRFTAHTYGEEDGLQELWVLLKDVLDWIIHQVPFNLVFYESDWSTLTHLENRLSSTVGIPLLFVCGSILPCLWSGRVSVLINVCLLVS